MRFAAQTATVRLVRYDESEVLRERFTGSEVSYFTAWNSAIFTAALAMMAKLGLLSRLATSRADLTPRHDPRRPQTVHLRAEAYGARDGRATARALEVEAESDYGATALMVAAVVRRLLDDHTGMRGVLTPMDVMSLEDLVPLLEGRDLRLSSQERP